MKTHHPSGPASPLPVPTSTSATLSEAVSIKEACRLIGVSRTKLYELIRAGELATLKIGARRLVRRDTARALLASKERAGIDRSAG